MQTPKLADAVARLREVEDAVWQALQDEYPLGCLVKAKRTGMGNGRVVQHLAADKTGVMVRLAGKEKECFVSAKNLALLSLDSPQGYVP